MRKPCRLLQGVLSGEKQTIGETTMTARRHIAIFSAGCPVCEEAILTVNKLVCPSCEVEVLDLYDPAVAARAASLSIRSIPAVVIDGKLADCCAGNGVSSEMLHAIGVGMPL